MRTLSRSSIFLACSMLATLASCQNTPKGVCGGMLFPDVPVRRVTVLDPMGNSLDGIALLALRAADGATGPGVAVSEIHRIDPTPTKGRGAMRLLVSAPGYRSTEVTLPQVCEINPSPVSVALARA